MHERKIITQHNLFEAVFVQKEKHLTQYIQFNVDRHKEIQLCLLFIYLLQNLEREKQPPLKPLDKVYPYAMAKKKMGKNVAKNKYYDPEYI